MDTKITKKQGQIADITLLARAGEAEPSLDHFDALEGYLLAVAASYSREYAALWEPKEPYCLLWTNPALEDWFYEHSLPGRGTPFCELFPEAKDSMPMLLDYALESNEPVQSPGLLVSSCPRSILPSGQYEDLAYWDVLVVPVKGQDAPIGALTLFRDVTEYKLQSGVLKSLERAFRSLPAPFRKQTSRSTLASALLKELMHTPLQALAIWEHEPPYRLVWENELHRRAIGDPSAQRLGASWQEVFPGAEGLGVLEVVTQVATTRKTYYNPGFPYVHPILGARYGLPGNLTYWDWRLSFLEDENGHPVGLLSSARDITEEKASQLQKKRLEAVLNTVPAGVVVTEGEDARITLLNNAARELLGESLEAGKTLQDILDSAAFVSGEGQPLRLHELPAHKALKRKQITRDFELVSRGPDGTEQHLLSFSAPVDFEELGINSAVTAFQDITRQKQIQAQLRQAYLHEHAVSEVLQRAVLSRSPERVEGYSIKTGYRPAFDQNLIGGDFFNAFQPDSEHLMLVIGDVAGKGIQAARRTAFVKYVLQGYTFEDPDPCSIAFRLNRCVCRVIDEDSFVTLFVGLLHLPSGKLKCACAGHTHPLIYRQNSRKASAACLKSGLPMGVCTDIEFPANHLQLNPGDRLLLYTDGVTEARRKREFYGTNRLSRVMKKFSLSSPGRAISEILLSVREFSGGELKDDIALLLLARDARPE